MKCNSPHKNLFAYTEGVLGAEERAAVERHLEVCGACREFMVALDGFSQTLDEDKVVQENPFFFTRVEARMNAAGREKAPFVKRVLIPNLIAASIFIGAVAAGVTIGKMHPSSLYVSESDLQEKRQYLNDMSHEPIESILITLYSSDHDEE